MRIAQRLIAASVLIALTAPLAGCGGGALSNLDPTDLFDFLDTKKKLPGERKPVFPEGVPGLQQGVPKELYRGAANEPPPEAAPPVEEPKSKRGSKARSGGKAKERAASRAPAPAADPDAAPAEESAPAAVPPAPKGQKIVRRRTTAPPPDAASEPAPAAAPAQSAPQSAFPAPLPSGGFSR